MQEQLVIVVDKVVARIFSAAGKPPRLSLIKELDHPEGRLRDRELTTDRPGRMYDDGRPNKSGYDAQTSAKEAELQRFIAEVVGVAKDLCGSRQKEAILIASPRVLGSLRAEIEKVPALKVTHEIRKDLAQEDPDRIGEYLEKEVM